MQVVYEAGPTGLGLGLAVRAVGFECVVTTLSKSQRPAGDRIKSDTRGVRHLAKLLRLHEIVEVTVPSDEQEKARDLVLAHEDACGCTMRCRHRLTKPLLRQGIVYYGGYPWNTVHDRWQRQQLFTGNTIAPMGAEPLVL